MDFDRRNNEMFNEEINSIQHTRETAQPQHVWISRTKTDVYMYMYRRKQWIAQGAHALITISVRTRASVISRHRAWLG